MLFVLGVGTLVAQANTLVAILCDQFKWMNATYVALITTICGFLCGIIYVTPVLMCAILYFFYLKSLKRGEPRLFTRAFVYNF